MNSPNGDGSFQTASFQTVLPRLVSAYEHGRLVPFIGAGLSAPSCRLWPAFVAELETQASVTFTGKDRPDSLIMRAGRAIASLRALNPEELVGRVRQALLESDGEIPQQTVALCQLWWPMILSTNYDDCVVKAFQAEYGEELKVCGRSVDDSHDVLNALYEPSPPILWALQGYLGNSASKRAVELAEQIVVGHEEYRKVAHSEPQFRRAFAEVFRSRSMLFLGSGLKEPYFREMFSEILEIYGPCTRPCAGSA